MLFRELFLPVLICNRISVEVNNVFILNSRFMIAKNMRIWVGREVAGWTIGDM